METQFNYDKTAADLIISKFENIPVTWEKNEGPRGEHVLFFKGSVVGCNDNGLFLRVDEFRDRMTLVMRGSEIPFVNFPFWQRRRLHKFFKAKLKAHRSEIAARTKAAQRDTLHSNLNTTLTELVRHGE